MPMYVAVLVYVLLLANDIVLVQTSTSKYELSLPYQLTGSRGLLLRMRSYHGGQPVDLMVRY